MLAHSAPQVGLVHALRAPPDCLLAPSLLLLQLQPGPLLSQQCHLEDVCPEVLGLCQLHPVTVQLAVVAGEVRVSPKPCHAVDCHHQQHEQQQRRVSRCAILLHQQLEVLRGRPQLHLLDCQGQQHLNRLLRPGPAAASAAPLQQQQQPPVLPPVLLLQGPQQLLRQPQAVKQRQQWEHLTLPLGVHLTGSREGCLLLRLLAQLHHLAAGLGH